MFPIIFRELPARLVCMPPATLHCRCLPLLICINTDSPKATFTSIYSSSPCFQRSKNFEYSSLEQGGHGRFLADKTATVMAAAAMFYFAKFRPRSWRSCFPPWRPCRTCGMYVMYIGTLQMFTHKLQINYYFQMLLLHMKMCKRFKSG